MTDFSKRRPKGQQVAMTAKWKANGSSEDAQKTSIEKEAKQRDGMLKSNFKSQKVLQVSPGFAGNR